MTIITKKDIKKTKEQIAELVNSKVKRYERSKKQAEEKSGMTYADIVSKLTEDEFKVLFNNFAALTVSCFAYDLEHPYIR